MHLRDSSKVSKKRKSTPQKSFPRGYLDISPGVVIQLGFGSVEGFVKRALSSSGTSSESNSIPGSPSSPSTNLADSHEQLPVLTSSQSVSRKRTRVAPNIVNTTNSRPTRQAARR